MSAELYISLHIFCARRAIPAARAEWNKNLQACAAIDSAREYAYNGRGTRGVCGLKRRAVAAALLAVLLAALLPMPEAEAAGKELTLMVYMCGSNLESRNAAASADLMEMATSGCDVKKVNVLVMTGGTESWALNLPTDALCVYMPGRGTLRMLYAFEPMSMGSSDALTALLAYGYENYPADRYALILWDHGGGPMNGVCWDEQYGSDHLTMDELYAALAASPAASQGLEWIGFDACLMASAEVAALMAPFARYMIASEETEPGTGWNYAFLKDIENDADGAATGRRIIDGYFEEGGDAGLTLSCTDLSRVAGLSASLDDFFPELEISGGNYALFSYAARNTRAFGKSAVAGDSYDLIDLGALVDQLAAQRPAEAAAVREALEDAVVYSRSGDGAGRGLSVYHPYENKAEYAQAWGGLYPSLGFSSGYTDYIARFASYLFGASDVAWSSLSATATNEESVYALPLTEGQQEMLSSAVMNLLRWDADSGAYAMVCAVNRVALDEGVLYAACPGQALAVVDGEGGALASAVPYETLPDGAFAVYVNYCRAGAETSDEAAALVAVDTRGVRKSFGSYTFEDNGAGSTSPDVSSGGEMTTAGSNVPEGENGAGSTSLGDLIPLSEYRVESLSPLSADIAQTLSVPSSVSLDTGVTPVSAGQGLFFAPSGAGNAEIVPLEITSMQLEGASPVIMGTVSSQIPLDSFATVSVESFNPEQVTIDLSGFELPSADADAQPDVVHAWLKCAADETGAVTVLETWLYDEKTGIWSTRGTLDASVYPVAAFPISWRQPVTADDALTGFDRWQECLTTASTVQGGAWSLRFIPREEEDGLCVSFQVTDAQNRTFSSAPLTVG